MKGNLSIGLIVLVFLLYKTCAHSQYPENDKWYQNPLGFKPVSLHTSMGFIIPAVISGTTLLLTQKDSSLHKKVSYYNESGMSWGYKSPNTFISQNNTGINIMLRKWMSLGAEVSFILPHDDYNQTFGTAVRPFARFYIFNKEKYRLYFESGGGIVYFFNEFPAPSLQDNRNGTYFNGITRYGVGSEIIITKAFSLRLNINHLHISNGNFLGAERNPSHDSNGFFIGMTYNPY